MAQLDEITFPNRTHRLAVVGRTGSGKTLAGLWHLSGKNFAREGWTIFDTKGDPHIREIGNMEGAKHIRLDQRPGKTGLHIVRPLPHQTDEVDSFIWQLWARENHGIYIDEGYMLGDLPALATTLTTGRTKQLPVIILSQRPRWITRFVFSEADFFQIFNLQTEDDRVTMDNFTRRRFGRHTLLPDFYSKWYDVGQDKIFDFAPVPPRETIFENFAKQLKPRKVFV